MKLLAYAKLNLALRIRGCRPDGFHEIDSLIQTIDLADTITVARTASGVDVSNDLGISLEEDLAARAAYLLLEEKDCREGVTIEVKKQIPIGAGLGGGSSDAAAVLWAVDRLTPPALPPDRLSCLAANLGADVPLFLSGGLVRVTGRGEEVASLPYVREEHFVVLVPPVHCVTAAVYKYLDSLDAPLEAGGDLCLGENDLEPAALALYPALLPYAQAIAKLDAEYSGMSGSGSSFFAAFARLERAVAAKGKLASSFPEASVRLCQRTHFGHAIRKED